MTSRLPWFQRLVDPRWRFCADTAFSARERCFRLSISARVSADANCSRTLRCRSTAANASVWSARTARANRRSLILFSDARSRTRAKSRSSVGGEWWRRLPPDSFAVLTSPYAGAAAFDAAQPFQVERVREPVLLPHPLMVRRIDDLAREVGADLVVLDPALPLGLVGPSLELPYDVVLHGAEVTVPGRLPGSKQALGVRAAPRPSHRRRRRLPGRRGRAGGGPALPITVVPPGVDTERFRPLDRRRAASRAAPLRHRRRRRADRRHQPARAAQGLRHGDPRRGACCAAAARPRAGDRRRGSRRARGCERLAERAARAGAVPRPGRQRRPAPPVRVRRRVHDAVPQPVGRARAGGVRHRVRRGRGVRRAAGGRRLRWSGRSGGRRRDRASWCAARTTIARSPPRSRRCSTTPRCARGWVRPSRSGPWPSSPTTCSPSGSAARSGLLMAVHRRPQRRPTSSRRRRAIVRADLVGTARCSASRPSSPRCVFTTGVPQWVAVGDASLVAVRDRRVRLPVGYWNAVQRSRTDEISVASCTSCSATRRRRRSGG